eukprot:PLAT15970.1.p1 GENE.PLAT15970.1~~PLAT15970.1.p1  ORF type:complete len:335 (+),score=157.87 PLAT15970.1:88-1092(+)
MADSETPPPPPPKPDDEDTEGGDVLLDVPPPPPPPSRGRPRRSVGAVPGPYDYASVASQVVAQEYIDRDEEILCSGAVIKVNKRGRRQERVLLATTRALHNLNPDNFSSLRRIPLQRVSKVTSSKTTFHFIFHVPSEYDYYFESKGKTIILDAIRPYYEKLTGHELEVEEVEAEDIAELVVTKEKAALDEVYVEAKRKLEEEGEEKVEAPEEGFGDDPAFVEMMDRGTDVLIYMPSGEVKPRHVWLNKSWVWLNIAKKKSDTRSKNGIHIMELRSVVAGNDTLPFQGSPEVPDESVCMSLTTKSDQTYDFECLSTEDRDLLVKGFQKIIATRVL